MRDNRSCQCLVDGPGALWARMACTRLLTPCAIALVLFLTFPGANAQLYTGSVTGVVTDPSKAVIANAHVTLTDADKGYEFKATTDGSGRYLFRSIPPGTYRLAVEAAGFETARKEGIKLDVTQNVSSDIVLKVGTTSQSVDVTASAVQLQTEDAVTGQVVNRKFVNDLPLLDRNFFNLTSLAPGVVETNVPGTASATNFNSNGSRNATADVLLDGASATNFEQNSGQTSAPYTPSVDSVEEFKVEQSNFTGSTASRAEPSSTSSPAPGPTNFTAASMSFCAIPLPTRTSGSPTKTETPSRR